MKLFFYKTILLLVPLVIWGAVVIIVDPFNYFNLSLLSNSSKKTAEKMNTLMYRTIDYINSPCENLLIGDSRTDALPINLIEDFSRHDFKKLNTNAAKLNEIFDLFYLANNQKPVKRIVIGINFNMFNKYGYQNRVSGLKSLMKSPLMYIYNKDVAEAVYYTLKSVFDIDGLSSKPAMTKEEFWKWNLEDKATHWYGKYEFPDTLYKQLLEFDKFTMENNIDVVFIIVPHHKDFHKKLIEFGLENDEKKFKLIMSKLNAKVYDFDFNNLITDSKNNFNDPVHYNDSVGNLIVKEVWLSKPTIGKKLN